VALTIYFAGAITGGRGDVVHYREIVAALENDGYRVLAGAVAAEQVGEDGEQLEPAVIFERDMGWLADADVLVAEVSVPSTGVGYEIATARYRHGIPAVCLHRGRRCSAMVRGDHGIELIEYEETSEMLSRLRASLAKYSAAGAGYPRRTPA
jgi:2'-deoxynucleoside 5'-phosphate N-hydrolase